MMRARTSPFTSARRYTVRRLYKRHPSVAHSVVASVAMRQRRMKKEWLAPSKNVLKTSRALRAELSIVLEGSKTQSDPNVTWQIWRAHQKAWEAAAAVHREKPSTIIARYAHASRSFLNAVMLGDNNGGGAKGGGSGGGEGVNDDDFDLKYNRADEFTSTAIILPSFYSAVALKEWKAAVDEAYAAQCDVFERTSRLLLAHQDTLKQFERAKNDLTAMERDLAELLAKKSTFGEQGDEEEEEQKEDDANNDNLDSEVELFRDLLREELHAVQQSTAILYKTIAGLQYGLEWLFEEEKHERDNMDEEEQEEVKEKEASSGTEWLSKRVQLFTSVVL